MLALVIDPTARTITEQDIPYEADGIKAIYAAGGFGCFDSARLDKENYCYVDDEGLLKQFTDGFLVLGYGGVLVGKGVVLGVDREGESMDATMPLEEARERIRFVKVTYFENSDRGIEVTVELVK